MENDILKITGKPVDELLVVIPDECGDSMWDKVLEQSAFVQAVRSASKTEPVDVKVTALKK